MGWRVLWATNEMLWNSERDDWSHLYLYDLATGRLKHQITSGPGPVTSIRHVDETTRTVYFTANGREPKLDPYFSHFYRIGLDGKGYARLTPDDGLPRRAGLALWPVRDRRRVHARAGAGGGRPRPGGGRR